MPLFLDLSSICARLVVHIIGRHPHLEMNITLLIKYPQNSSGSSRNLSKGGAPRKFLISDSGHEKTPIFASLTAYFATFSVEKSRLGHAERRHYPAFAGMPAN